jgi:mRNA interferase MazF
LNALLFGATLSHVAIEYHPALGEALWCDYTGIEPEMIKRRLVVVVTPKPSQRHKLTTVVPISATSPTTVLPWHVRLNRDPFPQGDKEELWVKCDMINVVCFGRLSGYHYRWNGARKYRTMSVSLDELRSIRRGILASLGIDQN